MNAAILRTAHAIMSRPRLANVETRIAITQRLYVLAEGLGSGQSCAALAGALRDCEAVATRNGDARLAAILRDARGEASAWAAYEGIAA